MAEDGIPLSASNVLGIVQRGIRELDAYLNQPWYRIDKRRALAYLGECAQWVDRLDPLPERDPRERPGSDVASEATGQLPPPLPAAQSQKRRS